MQAHKSSWARFSIVHKFIVLFVYRSSGNIVWILLCWDGIVTVLLDYGKYGPSQNQRWLQERSTAHRRSLLALSVNFLAALYILGRGTLSESLWWVVYYVSVGWILTNWNRVIRGYVSGIRYVNSVLPIDSWQLNVLSQTLTLTAFRKGWLDLNTCDKFITVYFRLTETTNSF